MLRTKRFFELLTEIDDGTAAVKLGKEQRSLALWNEIRFRSLLFMKCHGVEKDLKWQLENLSNDYTTCGSGACGSGYPRCWWWWLLANMRKHIRFLSAYRLPKTTTENCVSLRKYFFSRTFHNLLLAGRCEGSGFLGTLLLPTAAAARAKYTGNQSSLTLKHYKAYTKEIC